jgi:hypothetical protein
VTITPDRFVNKGPHRPAFPERLRAEALAALACVDFVGINEWPTAVETIEQLRPHMFVKGVVRETGKRDHTDAIDREKSAVEVAEWFSRRRDFYNPLINHTDVFSAEAKTFRSSSAPSTPEEVVATSSFETKGAGHRRPLSIHHFCSVMGKSGKEPARGSTTTEEYVGVPRSPTIFPLRGGWGGQKKVRSTRGRISSPRAQ